MRGLGNHATFLALRDLVRSNLTSFVFLCETKLSHRKAEDIRVKLGFSGCLTVDSIGASEGLMLLWMDTVSVTIRSFSAAHIDSVVNEGTSVWRFTGLYGNPRSHLRF